jgi:uncharacterized protein (TIGR03435 family)
MRTLLFNLGFATSAVIAIVAQQPLRPVFEVASIKEAASSPDERSTVVIGTPTSTSLQAGQFHVGIQIDGSRADYGFMTLADLIPYAYRLKPYQVSGPGWLNDTRWNVLARIPEGQSPARAPEMMQALLAERFKLVTHRENREQTVYALLVARGGSQLKEATATSDEDEAPTGAFSMKNDAKGITISGGAAGTMRLTPGPGGSMQMQLAKISMAGFADVLTQFMDRPVVDATDLKGRYQVALDVPMEAMAGMSFAQKVTAFAGLSAFGARGGAAPDSGAVSAAVVQAVKRLGLELQPRRAPVDTLVVDRVDRTPTAN